MKNVHFLKKVSLMAIWEETQTKGSLQMGFLEEKNLGFRPNHVKPPLPEC